MQTPKIKIVNGSQASSINKYMNTKRKLLNCNANIYFNRTCLEQNLTPKYAQIHIKITILKVSRWLRIMKFSLTIMRFHLQRCPVFRKPSPSRRDNSLANHCWSVYVYSYIRATYPWWSSASLRRTPGGGVFSQWMFLSLCSEHDLGF
jgi:hypothetical protein